MDFWEELASETVLPMADHKRKDYQPIDLSSKNNDLNKIDITSAQAFQLHVEKYLEQHKGKVAYGGYGEHRKLYERHQNFNGPGNDRSIHIGTDFWCPAGTVVKTPLSGKVHSFGDNKGNGDYGPTIILEHDYHDQSFFSLYGHLSKDSIEHLKQGIQFKKGQPLAKLGNAEINGGYAPHLHFQLILNLENKSGDYPGVCSQENWPYYHKNCPDPKAFFKL